MTIEERIEEAGVALRKTCLEESHGAALPRGACLICTGAILRALVSETARRAAEIADEHHKGCDKLCSNHAGARQVADKLRAAFGLAPGGGEGR